MPDLAVIGAGLTGLTAALTAAQAGMSVRVVAKGMGTLHWTAGTIDLYGYAPDGEAVEYPLSEVDRSTSPHPYATFNVGRIHEALSWFQKEVSAGGLDYCVARGNGSSQQNVPIDFNLWLPSPAGAKRPAYLAPEGQSAGDLCDDTPMVIVGLDGMRDFYPELIASNLTKQGVVARAAHIPIDIVTDRIDFNTVQLASALDDMQTAQRFASILADQSRPYERIGVPAIMGLNSHAAVLGVLQDTTASPVFEIPTLPPSVPGIRLHRALHSRLASLGVRIETGMEVIGFQTANGNILSVETETSARPLRHQAERFLLATGGVLGGGFTGHVDGSFTEDVFNLPLTAPTDRSSWFRAEFLDPLGQPIFHAGVEVNEEYRPVDAEGHVVYSNLWAAGGMLAHADPIRERSLEGLAIATGRAAAQAILTEAGASAVMN